MYKRQAKGLGQQDAGGHRIRKSREIPVSYTHLDVYKRQGYDIWQFTDSGPFVGDSNFFPGSVEDLKVLAKNPKAEHRNWAKDNQPTQNPNVVVTPTGSIDIRTGIGVAWNLSLIHI